MCAAERCLIWLAFVIIKRCKLVLCFAMTCEEIIFVMGD
jgi:hypothetical protein